jgi:hypothetical protein
MAKLLASHLRDTVSNELESLLTISEEAARLSANKGEWAPKEVLGHLIDSAANNHMRFVRGALDGSYEGPGYEQESWVDIHGYSEMQWSDLVEFWRRYNEILARVLDRMPEERLHSPCRIGVGEVVTLGFVVEDYVRHMRHHLEQIRQRSAAKA